MTFKSYLQNELPPEFISGDKGIGWFDLHKIYSTCPARYKFEERDNKNVTAIAEHAAILNPAEFERRFIREPAKEDYVDALTSDKDICAWLKDKGVGGYSGKKYPELLELVKQTGDKPLIWNELLAEFYSSIGNKSAVPASTFDKILQMRAVIFGNKKFAEKVSDSFNDVTLIGEFNGVLMHLRYDVISHNGDIIDYVGCTSADPDEFKNQAIRGGYYMKQALLHDAFVQAYGHRPASQSILAQERNFPNIPVNFNITDVFLEIGRIQYKAAINLFKQCSEKDVWPTYTLNDDATDLEVPSWYSKRFGLEVK
ncbi:MAG: hypothetical protein [Bacteriophage sp.]|nr:MAG: hypothetical protein [Bacteriophage sp.]